MEKCRLLKIISSFLSVLLLVSCYREPAYPETSIAIADYLIVSTTNSLLDSSVKIRSLNESGEVLSYTEIEAGGAWRSEVFDKVIAILSSKTALIINVENVGITKIEAEASIEQIYINRNDAVFTVNKGYDSNQGKYSSSVCLLQFVGKDKYSTSDYDCVNESFTPFDIILNDNSIHVLCSDFLSLKETLVEYDKSLNVVKKKEVPTLGGYFLSSDNNPIILYDFDNYYFLERDIIVTTNKSPKSFTYVDKFGEGYLRTNFNTPGSEIYYETISAETGVSSELLLSSGQGNLSVIGIYDPHYFSVLDNSSDKQYIRFYDYLDKVFDIFYYEVPIGEEVICAYKLK